ncbi:hypothetical protein BKA59DRAFT_469146 [Fusarium tricinctum]|uniref:Transmembrane protein n=1 Tax=Fusarium tricinctum TaxID=61284 RepID=A0A8K0WEZ6_9HYPO|nr:hypothetical protein BKA59DRAFT_469146 [Fusarium tricinctum]
MLNQPIEVREQSYSTFTTSSSPSSTGFNSTSSSSFSSFLSTDDDNMRKGTRPPPLNLSIVPRPRSLPRLSTTPLAKELTPLLTPLPEEVEEPCGPVLRAVRIAVDFMQIVSCLLVILMLAIFLVSYTGAAVSSHGIRAIILIVALSCDIGLGMWSIVHHDRQWSGPAVLLRIFTASVLVCSLVSIVVMDRVFPADYTYWGLPLSQSGALVLGLLSAILGWDVVHFMLSQRITECWGRMCSWLQQQKLRRSIMSNRGHRRRRSGPWWFSSRQRQTAVEKRGWICVA